jgi:sugar lactone lactonase YvrE
LFFLLSALVPGVLLPRPGWGGSSARRESGDPAPVETVAEGFAQPMGVVVGPDGEIWISDRRSGEVSRIGPGVAQAVVTGLRQPAGLAFDREGRLLILEEGAGRLLRLEDSGALTILARGLDKPRWIAVAEDGTAYVSTRGLKARGHRRSDGLDHGDDDDDGGDDDRGDVVLRLVPDGSAKVWVAGFKRLEGIVVHQQTLFAVARGGIFEVLVNPDGSAGAIHRLSRAVGEKPVGLARDALGAFYVTADRGVREARSGARICKVAPDGAVMGSVHARGTLSGLALDRSGNLYAASVRGGEDGRILRFRAPLPPVLVAPPFTNQDPLTVDGTAQPHSRIDVVLNGSVQPPLLAPDGGFTLSLDLRPNSHNSLSVFATPPHGLGLSTRAEAVVAHDDVPAEILGVQPVEGSFLNDATPAMRGDFRDGVSGVDAGGVDLRLDGVDVTPQTQVTQALFAFTPAAPLAEGEHALLVRAFDRAGNAASAGSSFIVDLTSPVVANLSPANSTVTSALLRMRADFSDRLSGIDPGRVSVVLDGVDVTSQAVVNPAGFTLDPTGALAEGLHTLAVSVGDRAGNSTSSSAAFTVQSTRPVASVRITPGAVLLTVTGDSRTLSAQVLDADGNPLPVAAAWTSSRPGIVHVDDAGRITAGASVGSTQIVAIADGVASAPAMVVVARPAAGAVLIRDNQVVGAPELVDPEAPFDVGARYRTTLRDLAAPVPGTILLGTEEIPLAGRVVEAEDTGGLVTVTLEVVPVPDLVSDLVIDETVDLSRIEPEISEEVKELFTVTRGPDGRLEFVPKDATPNGGRALRAAVRTGGSPSPQSSTPIEFRVPPFDCEAEVVFPLINVTVGSMSLSHTLNVDFIYNSSAGGLQRLALKGNATAKIQAKATLTGAVQGKAECKLELSKIPVPLPPFLRVAFKPEVPVGVGFGIGGTVTVAGVGVEPSAEASIDTEVGLSCPGGQNCQALSSLVPKADGALNPKLPSLTNPTAQFRVEPEASAFAFVAFEDKGPLIKAIGLKPILEGRGGLKQAANLATVEGQIADDSYKSDYKLTLEGSAGLGAGVEQVVRYFRLSVSGELKKEATILLARSPEATKIERDRTSFAFGDTVRFTVTLDPSTLTYPIPATAPIPAFVYNVQEVKIFQKKSLAGGGFEPVLIASRSATSGQQTFSLQGSAVEASTSAPVDPFYAFVKTTFLPLPLIGDLELGQGPRMRVTVKQGTTSLGSVDGTYIGWHIDDEDENPICCNPVLLAADQPPPVTLSGGGIGMTLSVLEPSVNVMGIDATGSGFADPHSGACSLGGGSARAELSFEKPGTLQIDIETGWFASKRVAASWTLDTGESEHCRDQGTFICDVGPSTSVAITQAGTRILDVKTAIGLSCNSGTFSAHGRAVTVKFSPAP